MCSRSLLVSHKVASSVYMLTLELGIASGRLLIYKEKSTGPKIEPLRLVLVHQIVSH